MNKNNEIVDIPFTVPAVKASDMILRDYFAAKAMQGLLSSLETLKVLQSTAEKSGTDADRVTAIRAYQFADAMLKERAK